MGRLFPDRAKEIDQIRAQFNAYNEEAARMDDEYLNHRLVLRDWLPHIQEMNANLVVTRTKLKELRAKFYDDFSRSVAKTQVGDAVEPRPEPRARHDEHLLHGRAGLPHPQQPAHDGDVSDQNANLEQRVTERTLALRQKTADIQTMLQNMPQGVLTIVAGNKIHPEYSAYLETIFETTSIADRDLMASCSATPRWAPTRCPR